MGINQNFKSFATSFDPDFTHNETYAVVAPMARRVTAAALKYTILRSRKIYFICVDRLKYERYQLRGGSR